MRRVLREMLTIVVYVLVLMTLLVGIVMTEDDTVRYVDDHGFVHEAR